MNIPIDNSYWIIPGRFLAGEYPRNPNHESSIAMLPSLLDVGIRVFIDLTTSADGLSSYVGMLQTLDQQTEHMTFPIPDVSVPDKREITIAVLGAIDSSLARGKGVCIHCWGGVGRTGTMVGRWLARHGLAGDSALAKLEELWGCPKSRFRNSP